MHNSLKYLSVHVETTGLNYDIEKPVCEGHDIVVASFAVCDHNFKLLDYLTVHFKQKNENYGQEYHGITPAILEECGVSEEEGLIEISNFILSHFDAEEYIACLGQNVHSFTVPFLKQFFYRNEVFFKFSTNAIEIFSLTTPTIGPYTVAELIRTFADSSEIGVEDLDGVKYLSLMKAVTFVTVTRKISKLWKKLTK